MKRRLWQDNDGWFDDVPWWIMVLAVLSAVASMALIGAIIWGIVQITGWVTSQ